jgi:pSer/pThr/pTyr-binding forkhead associated (FHA) protein
MPWLLRLDPTGKTSVQSWEIGKNPMVIGRADGIDITIEDDEMSRRHFEIKPASGSYVLTDLNSTNGTWVNGKRVQHSYLQSGDKIQVGHTQLMYQTGTSTMLGFVEEVAGTTFKQELNRIYKRVDSDEG